MSFILRLAPCFVAPARAVLLSALAFNKNDSPISFSIARAKINSADNAPRAYISDSPLDKATVPVLDIHSSREIDQRNSVQDVLFLVFGLPARPASEYPVMYS